MKATALLSAHLDCIRIVLGKFPEVEKALLFGSRAKGTNRPGSDMDIAIQGANISPMTVARVKAEMDESNLPFRVDVVWHNEKLNPNLTAHIQRIGRVIYDAARKSGVAFRN